MDERDSSPVRTAAFPPARATEMADRDASPVRTAASPRALATAMADRDASPIRTAASPLARATATDDRDASPTRTAASPPASATAMAVGDASDGADDVRGQAREALGLHHRGQQWEALIRATEMADRDAPEGADDVRDQARQAVELHHAGQPLEALVRATEMTDRDAPEGADDVRGQAREALKLHHAGEKREALVRAVQLARAHPDSAVALNLAGALHQHAAVAAWTRRAPGDEEAAALAVKCHRGAALHAFAAAARLAPECVQTAVAHAEELSACERYGDAQEELRRAVVLTQTGHADPAVHNVGYDLFRRSTAEERKKDAADMVRGSLERFAKTICGEVIPREAVQLLKDNKLGGHAAVQVRERAKLLARSYPFSGRAQLLRAYVDLAQVRALNLVDKTRFLRRTLSMIDEAADTFDGSLVIALFHARVLFVLDEYDAAESECRRALGIEWPNDPKEHDIPPGSVSGADYDARVSSVKRHLLILLKQIIFAVAVHWRSMIRSQQDERIISVRVDTLHEHYNRIDQSAAKTISDARRFVKMHNSWSFWICPHSHCDGKKFVDTDALWRHLCSKHREELWEKLQSVLSPKLLDCSSNDDYSLDGITLCQDSGQHDIFRLPRMQDMFESLLLWPSIGIQAEPFAQMRKRKCTEGSEILEGIKEKLSTLPADIFSTEFEECRFGIQNLWLKFLEISVLDYREVIFPLARSFQWIEIKRWIAYNANVAGRIVGDANIDTVFGRVPDAPDRNVSVENGSNPSHTNNMDHQNGDNLRTENLKLPGSDETLKADEKCEESKVRIEDRNSGTMVNQRSSDPPIDLDENGTSGQSGEKMASTSSYQSSVNVFNENSADKDLFILRLIIQSMCNLRHFRDKYLTMPLVWIPSVDNPCIGNIFYEIFSAWEKNERHLTDVLLTNVKTILCGFVDGSNFYEKVGKNFTSEVVATILIGLHMSETSSRFSFNRETERQVVNPITCGDCICATHNIFGIKFDAQMSCGCGECSNEYLYTTLFHKLDAGSPQTTKIKSFADLPVILDEQFCEDSNCEHCGSPHNIDLFLSNTPHIFTIVLNWLGGSENQDTLFEVLTHITSPLDTEFFCRSAHSATKYTVASMICYAGERYVYFARDEDKWLIHDSENVETEDTWEHLLERFKDCKLQPEVLFFEVIK